jgi:hypothetical protein
MTKRFLTILTVGAVVLSGWFLATPVADAAVVVAPTLPVHRRTVVHGTLANHHVTHAAHVVKPRAAAAPAAKKPAVVHVKTVHRPVTRSRRVAHARHHRPGGVGGHVRSASGEPVVGAIVSVGKSGHSRAAINRHVHISHKTTTDSSGHFAMRGIRAGSHRVMASKTGIGKGGKSVHVRPGAMRSIEIKLGTTTSHKHKRHHKHK